MEEVASFGGWLKVRRQALDLTQEELAQRLNCALGTVRKWETEERRPSRELAEQLAVVLELAPEERRTFVKVARAELAVDHLRPSSRRALPGQALPPTEPAPSARHAPLHTADRRPTNLPVLRERLIGRERELVEAAALLRRGDVGLVTLTGPGGVGKTRLALEVAAEVLETFADGAWFVDLAPISDPALVAPTIAQTLGIKETGGQPIGATLKAFLRVQHLLLVLDNFEQVVAGAALLDDLLRAASGLKILVTSREVLGVYGEHDMEVPPLALPDLAHLPPPAQLAQYEAVRLFTERARAAKADFQVTGEIAPAVAEICYRLDGLPLAIELAAVRIRLLPPQALLHRLTQRVPGRLTLLTGGARTLPVRQQTLRDAIAWSYNLLEPGEQTLFRRLAVFAGGWTLEAAEAVCGGEPEELVGAEGQSGYPLAGEGAQETGDEASVPSVPMPPTSLPSVLDGLQSLVDKSLLRPLEAARVALAAEPRFGMLETIREYAREQWHNADERERLRSRHLDFFLKLAEDAEPHLHSTDQIIWIARLERERDNLRAALEFALEQHVERAIRLVGALGWFWTMRGYLSEGRHWLDLALAADRAALSDWQKLQPHQSAYRGSALYSAGLVAHFQGDYATAETMFDTSRLIWRELKDNKRIGHTQLIWGLTKTWQGDFAAAQALTEESAALFRASHESWGLAFSLNNLGFSLLAQGDYARARPLLEESLALFRKAGDRLGIGWSLANLGSLAYRQGNLDRGQALLEESLATAREFEDAITTGWAMKELGHIARQQGDYARAVELYEAGLALSRTAGFQSGIAEMLRSLGDVALREGAYQKAGALVRESLALSANQGDHYNTVACLASLAELACATQAFALAARLSGVVEAHVVATGASMSPDDRAAFDRIVGAARAQLDAAAFESAWAEGRAMLLEQAIAYALEVPS